MYPGEWARTAPERPAVVMAGSGRTVTYAELDERSRRLSAHLRSAGLVRGDRLAVLLENHERYFEVVWAGLRSGLYVTPVNRHLTPDEAAYIVEDSGAAALVASAATAGVASAIRDRVPAVRTALMIGDPAPGFAGYDSALADADPGPEVGPCGDLMLYSSGTTGRPKGIRRALPGPTIAEGTPYVPRIAPLYGFRAGCVYLSPAPLYHSAPLHFSLVVQAVGGTVVVMERFEAAAALEAVERFRVTHSQWVPTMFVRMLKLPAEQRAAYDTASLEVAIHASAPCPVWAKEAMIDWWGPILTEYYGGTEGNGATVITSEEWLAHKGSVGRPNGVAVHICDADGREVPAGTSGLVYFASAAFEYHGDAAKTHATRHPQQRGWSTLGDIGYLGPDGYLYLVDRQHFMIVSGGVNIYPQEVEDVLLAHPAVDDVAVFGVPHDDLGEVVKAVVQPSGGEGGALEDELLRYCRDRLASYKCPRTIDFRTTLPRLDSGKLYKRQLRDEYWTNHATRVL